MSEAALVDACLRYLRIRGAMVWRNNTGMAVYGRPGARQRFVRFGPVGGSDILGVAPDGRAVVVECKRGRNTPTWAQSEFVREAESRGAFALVVWSVEQLIAAWEVAYGRAQNE